jgi:CRP/FNR family transcriptional regulator, cyclic AMP receptor protein
VIENTNDGFGTARAFKENKISFRRGPMSHKCQNCSNAGKHPFCSLGDEARSFLESQSVGVEYPRGTVLFREGDQCDAIFVVCSGKIKVSVTSREGRTMIFRIAHGGDVLGMSAALGGEPFEVTAEALEPSRVRVLHLKPLEHLLHHFAGATMCAAKALAEDYKIAFDDARRLALPDTPAGRLARLLLDWAEEAKSGTSTPTITMALTHQELASMTATTRETITRTLGRFRKKKLIAIRGVALTLLQPSALEQLSAC